MFERGRKAREFSSGRLSVTVPARGPTGETMTTNAKANAGFTAKFHNIFKPRDIFLHDGKSLRRFTIGARVQMAAVLAAFAFAGLVRLRHLPGDRAR